MSKILNIKNVGKSFTLHTQGSLEIPVFKGIDFSIKAGECIALTGASGAGKSTFMRMIYANYICSQGSIEIRHKGDWLNLVAATPHEVIDVRCHTLGYVSQFLRVIPRVATLEIVAEPLIATGVAKDIAIEKAKSLLARLRIPEHLWTLSPLTFSGGEQQRVNIARSFIVDYPIMLLDEPTASLDQANRHTVFDFIEEAKKKGTAVIGIFHDQEARDTLCTGTFDVTQYQV